MTAAWVSAVAFAAAGFVAATFVPLVGLALALASATNLALLVTHARPEANSPLRILTPVLVMTLSHVEAANPLNARAYHVARLVFALAVASEVAPVLFVWRNEWPLPILSTMVCLWIVFVGVMPERKLRWLLA